MPMVPHHTLLKGALNSQFFLSGFTAECQNIWPQSCPSLILMCNVRIQRKWVINKLQCKGYIFYNPMTLDTLFIEMLVIMIKYWTIVGQVNNINDLSMCFNDTTWWRSQFTKQTKLQFSLLTVLETKDQFVNWRLLCFSVCNTKLWMVILFDCLKYIFQN
jgi:hypothetical protein